MLAVERGYVQVGERLVHFRCCGSGPAIVLLHDSPRSSRLHIATMRELGGRFRVYALDTPGYGNSTPLHLDCPKIDDFGAALGEALAVLKLERAPLYATHTSAKIALAYAVSQSRTPLLVLDGLSIPISPPDPAFIRAYMRPFRLDDSGGYLASEWTRVRDMLRWFPWFDHRLENRLAMTAPGPEWVADYVIDLFSTGPHFSDAYAAAMYYDPLPALARVSVPTRIAARSDDVLHSALDRVPLSANASLSVERLPADRSAWLRWLEATLAEGCAVGDAPGELPFAADHSTPSFYVHLPHGQMRVHRRGPARGRPLLILGSPTSQSAVPWQEALATTCPTLLPELPGYGESDPLANGGAESFVDALTAMLDAIGVPMVDVLAAGFAVPLAALLASRHPVRVASLVLDGLPPLESASASCLSEQLCPCFAFDLSGAYLHQLWHMLRDSQAQWPWFDHTLEARRKLAPDFRAAVLHQILTDLLKQPLNYGDSARAALAVNGEDLYRSVSVPALVFDHADDPAYRPAPRIAALLPDARVVARPAEMPAAARVLEGFLDDMRRTSPGARAPAVEFHE